MAILKGKDGALNINGVAMSVTNWTLESSIGTGETTTIGLKDQTHEYTTRSATGSATANLDVTNAQQKVIIDMLLGSNYPSKVWLVLYQDSANTKLISFSAVISSISLPKSANNIDQLSFNFIKDGTNLQVPTT